MSAIQPVSFAVSTASAVSFNSPAAPGDLDGAGAGAPGAIDVDGLPTGGVLATQVATLMESARQSGISDPLAALVLALLLSRSSDSDDKDKSDPLMMLAALALLGGGRNGLNVEFNTSTTVSASYSASAAPAAAGGAVNMTG